LVSGIAAEYRVLPRFDLAFIHFFWRTQELCGLTSPAAAHALD